MTLPPESPATPSPPSPFNPGALVRLRSGGPVMTVRSVTENAKIYGCLWFVAEMPVERLFNNYELEAVQDNRWLDQPDGPGYWWLEEGGYRRLVEVDKDMEVWWHGSEIGQMAHTITGHKWCKAADEPPARS